MHLPGIQYLAQFPHSSRYIIFISQHHGQMIPDLTVLRILFQQHFQQIEPCLQIPFGRQSPGFLEHGRDVVLIFRFLAICIIALLIIRQFNLRGMQFTFRPRLCLLFFSRQIALIPCFFSIGHACHVHFFLLIFAVDDINFLFIVRRYIYPPVNAHFFLPIVSNYLRGNARHRPRFESHPGRFVTDKVEKSIIILSCKLCERIVI